MTLRASVLASVREAILDGSLAPGSRINESQLSVELGVSRTPLREALAALERERMIVAHPAQGFFVTELTVREIVELYPVARTLDLLALRTIRRFDKRCIESLRRLNVRFRAARANAARAYAADAAFHVTLIEPCPNRRLMAALNDLKGSLERYERVFMGDARDVERSATHHDRIVDALDRDDMPGAVEALSDNWTFGAERLLQRMGEPGAIAW